MQILNDTRFKTGFKVWQVRPPRPSLTLVVKATYVLVDGVCRLADEQREIAGDTYLDDDEQRALRFENDMALLKPQGECVLAGACHAPGGRAVATSAVAFQVGPIKKALAVFGDRYWKQGLFASGATEPEPFTRMELSWERSFGGAGYDANPLGRGLADVPTREGPRRPLPNIEDPRALVGSPAARPAPAGAFPIAPSWRARVRLAGTYDERWRKTRWPWLPEDFDWHYFNAAPADQRVPAYFRGDEEIALRNLVPGQVELRTRLPGARVRCFLETQRAGARALAEVAMNLDTIALDADASRVVCLWRGLSEVATEDLSDVARVMVVPAPLDDRRPLAHFESHLAAADARARADDAAFEPEAVPDAGLGAPPDAPAPPAGAAVLARLAAGESLAGADLTAVDLAAADLRGADLSRALLSRARLTRAQLRGARLAGAQLGGAHLAGADLREADLAGADLAGADLTGADLTGAVLDRASLESARLAGARLAGASCAGAEFTGADLAGAQLAGARGRGAGFVRATLEGADLRAASLPEATLEACRAARAVLDEADLSAVRAGAAVLDDASLKGARLAGARLAGAQLARAELSFADLARADLDGAALAGARLNGARLRGAVFRGANLAGAALIKSDAMAAVFDDADLTGADLRGANLFSASFWRARTGGARLELANIERTTLVR